MPTTHKAHLLFPEMKSRVRNNPGPQEVHSFNKPKQKLGL